MTGREHFKTLTITGTSFTEMRSLLEQAHQQGMEQVVILTHPFEYVQTRDCTARHIRPHHVNQKRLDKLCAFLHQHPDRFDACGMAAAASAPMLAASSRNVLLDGSLLNALPRMVVQAAYEQYSQWRVKHQHLPAQVDRHDLDNFLPTARLHER